MVAKYLTTILLSIFCVQLAYADITSPTIKVRSGTLNTVETVDSITSITTIDSIGELDNVTLVDTVTEVANVTSVDQLDNVTEVHHITNLDTVDTISDIAGGIIDTVSDITGGTIDTVSSVTAVTSITNPVNTYIIDPTTLDGAELDDSTNTMQTIEYEHHEIHSGSHFMYSDYDNDVDTGTPKYYRITTPDTTKELHVLIILYSEGAGTWWLYENPTVNAAGTPATLYNSNRNSGTTATGVIAPDPTSTADGTLLKTWRTGSGTNASSRIGGESNRGLEIILKRNEDYFVKFTPDADNAKTKVEIDFYEHVPKN